MSERQRDQRTVSLALVLTFLYFVAEAVGGYLTNSLALLSDAAHMFTDVAALSLTLFALWVAGRPATETKTYGYYRAEILAALVNGLFLWLVVVYIFYQAYGRFFHPPVVRGGGVLAVASLGLLVNLAVAWLLWGRTGRSLNIRGAFLHVVSDFLGSVGTGVAGVVMLVTGWYPVDTLVALCIGVLILFSSWSLIREAVDVLMEAVPQHIDVEEVRRDLEKVPGTEEVHDLHVWTLTTGKYALSAHAVVDKTVTGDDILADMSHRLAEKFHIHHVTIQLEHSNRRASEPGD